MQIIADDFDKCIEILTGYERQMYGLDPLARRAALYAMIEKHTLNLLYLKYFTSEEKLKEFDELVLEMIRQYWKPKDENITK
jgi:hypothetical protein